MAAPAEGGHGRIRDRALSIGRGLVADFHQLELFTYANAIAFCVLFALVPFGLFAVALLGFLDLTVLWTRDVAPGVGAVVGPSAFGVLDATVRQILATRQGYWLTAGLALTVWELSNAVFAVGGALNRIYRVREERPLWRQLGRSMVLGVVVGICLLGTLAVTQVVPGVAERALGPGTFASVLGFVARWVVAVAAMLLVVGVLIRYAPAEPVRWRWVGTGTLVTVGSWTLTSIGFGAYLSGLANYGSLFGGLALPFVLLLYLYVAALALLLGVWVERRQRVGVDRPAVGEGAEAS